MRAVAMLTGTSSRTRRPGPEAACDGYLPADLLDGLSDDIHADAAP